MNKAIVINQDGDITLIECKDNAEALQLFEYLNTKHEEDLEKYKSFDVNKIYNPNVTLIFSDGSIKNSRHMQFAKPTAFNFKLHKEK